MFTSETPETVSEVFSRSFWLWQRWLWLRLRDSPKLYIVFIRQLNLRRRSEEIMWLRQDTYILLSQMSVLTHTSVGNGSHPGTKYVNSLR